jgi:hypothetical protein
VRGSRAQVQAQVEKHAHVRALIINDDKTVLIAGVLGECLAVAKALDCTPIPVPQGPCGRRRRLRSGLTRGGGTGMCGHCKEVEPFKLGIEHIHEHVLLPDTSKLDLYSSQTRAPLRGAEG